MRLHKTSRGGLLASGVIYCFIGVFAAVFAILIFAPCWPGSVNESNCIAAAVFSLVSLLVGIVSLRWGYGLLARVPYEISLNADGSILFRRVFNALIICPSDISSLCKIEHWGHLVIWEEYAGELRVRWGSQTIPVPYFTEINKLIHHLKELNPAIEIEGSWRKEMLGDVAPEESEKNQQGAG